MHGNTSVKSKGKGRPNPENASNPSTRKGRGLSMAGGEGFEPSTPNLGGWCSIQNQPFSPSTSHMQGTRQYGWFIRTELLAQSALFEKQIPAIQTLLLNLERKGRSPRTVMFYEKCLKGLAKRSTYKNRNKAHANYWNSGADWQRTQTTNLNLKSLHKNIIESIGLWIHELLPSLWR